MSDTRMRYMIEGRGEAGGVWESSYAGPDASCTTLREAMTCVRSLRALGDEWRGPWRIVRLTDNRVVAQWDAQGRRG